MRRGFSIFLILLFGLGPLSLLIGGSEDANLPACCRRHGMHHCAMITGAAAMSGQAQSGDTPVFSAPVTCPYYPSAANALWSPPPALTAAAANVQALDGSNLAQTAEQPAALSNPAQTRTGRGPPIASLS